VTPNFGNWVKCTAATNAGSDPIGGSTANLVTCSAQGAARAQVISAIPGKTYTFSVFLAQGNAGMGYVSLVVNSGYAGGGITSYAATRLCNLNSALTLCSVTYTVPTSGVNQLEFDITGSAAGTFYAWGAQGILGTNPGIYIPIGAMPIPGVCTNQVMTGIANGAAPTCAAVSNAMLANPSMTVNGSTWSLGGSYTVSAASLRGLPTCSNGSVTPPCIFTATGLTASQFNSIFSSLAAGTYRVTGTVYTTTAGTAGTVSLSLSSSGCNNTVTSSAASLTSVTVAAQKSVSNLIQSVPGVSSGVCYATTVSGATGSPVYGVSILFE
jgi:hypothetical protein